MHASGRHGRRKARGETSVVFLDRPAEREPDALAGGVAGEGGQQLPVVGRAGLGGPALDRGPVVGQAGDIEVRARGVLERFAVGQGHQARQTGGEPARAVEDRSASLAVQGFGQGALMPASGQDDLVGLAGFRHGGQPRGRFLDPAQVHEREPEAVSHERGAGIDREGPLGGLQGVGPAVRQAMNAGFQMEDPAVLGSERVRETQAVAGPIEVTEHRPRVGERGVPGRAQFGVIAAEIGMGDEILELVEQADPAMIGAVSEIADQRIGGVPAVGFSKQPTRETLAAEPVGRSGAEDDRLHRKRIHVGGGGPVFGRQRVEVKKAMAVVDGLEMPERGGQPASRRVIRCHGASLPANRPSAENIDSVQRIPPGGNELSNLCQEKANVPSTYVNSGMIRRAFPRDRFFSRQNRCFGGSPLRSDFTIDSVENGR
ncbi:MAG: hypothetical protein H6P98_2212 [Candidatus Aminicenantes bacterium]|nr:hypothetical protein [Candidatus Aminicenantes bacterium]